MTDTDGIVKAGEDLFQYAIDRNDMNAVLATLPVEAPEKRVAMEYELQLLRIVSVGWAIAYFLSEISSIKTSLGQQFWENVRSFSLTLSESASLTVGSDIDYFDILKQRFDMYLHALDDAGQVADPVMAVGPAFADVCGDGNDACAMLAGSKMFTLTINAVREYLDSQVVK